MFRKADVFTETLNPFHEFSNNWALVTAEKGGKANTMTIGWAGLGILWGKPVATIYLRQSRYTKEFVDAQDTFTVSFFEDRNRELMILGSMSGRDGDKIAEAGFHLTELDGAPAFEEAKAVMVCRKWYQADITPETMPPDVVKEFYEDGDFHTMYIGEITGYYVKE